MMNANIPHFFKIIFSNTISQGKIGIPKMFVKRFGNHLSDKVFLKVPSGPKWQVELLRNGDRIYFGNGWQQFAEYYSLAHGSFLIFGLEDFETCCFSVTIFDQSASEIDYPEITASSDVSSRPCKKMKQGPICAEQSHENRQNPEVPVKKKLPMADEKAIEVNRATTCDDKNPSFSITMRPAYVSERYRLTVPPTFAVKYFSEERGKTILNTGDGKTWPVGYVKYKSNCARTFTIISLGWKKFVCENHLEVGDVCSFELNNGNADELKVVISRKDGDATTTSSSTGNNKKAIMGDLMLENPNFIVELTENFLRKHYVNVPAKFVEKWTNNISGETAMLQVGKKVWLAKLLRYPSHRIFHLSEGLGDFFRDNDLQVGDTCVFELINSISFLLKVYIFRDED